jgi:uncharacterized protein YbjT (DUF2867 family)
MEPGKKKALLAGASGLIGSMLLPRLLASDHYQQVTVLVRRRLPMEHPKLSQVEADFERLEAYRELFQVDEVFCTLGTTIKKAGSQAAFEQVDLQYPLQLGRLAKACGVRTFLIVTAMGANAQSPFFYNRVKGRVEEQLCGLGLPALAIFRPSLLLGERQEFRLGERIGAAVSQALAFAFVGPLQKYKPIHGETVAEAMFRVAQGEASAAVRVYESAEIAQIARESF